MGVVRFALDQQIQLTAVPKPGYQFVYWLGDVSDPQAVTTTAYIDKPKIIIAVFEKVSYEAVSTGVGAGGRVSTPGLAPAGDVSAPSGSYGGGGGDEGDDPDDPDVPEPATCVLLLTGGLLALRRRR